MPSIIGWIKNGRKGKSLAYMPASYPSERVAYGSGSVKDTLDGLQYEEIATAAASQTWAAQLTYLEPYFNALSDADKYRSAILVDDGTEVYVISRLVHMKYKRYVGHDGDSASLYTYMMNLSDHTRYTTKIENNTYPTLTNNSTSTNSRKLKLVLLK